MKIKIASEKAFLQLFFLVKVCLLNIGLSAQQICGTPADLSSSCTDACILCDLDGFSAYSPSGVIGTLPPGFCTQFQHGVHYIGFIPQTTSLDLNISIFNCMPSGNPGGLEMGIYKSHDCIDFELVSNCNTNMYNSQTWPINSNKPLVPGKIYYLVIDENGPNSCEFSVDVMAGSTKSEAVKFAGNISGPLKLCPGQIGSYMVPSSTGNPCEFDWTLDGNSAGDGKVLDISIIEPGIHQLCVHASNLCFPDGDETCIDILVEELPITKTGPFTVCEADLPFDFGDDSFFSGGTFQVSFTTPKNCDSIVEFTLNVIPEKINDLGLISLCLGESIKVNDIEFSKLGNYEELIPTNYPPYCDSTVYFQIAIDTVVSLPMVTGILGCYTDSVLITSIDSYPAGQININWFDKDSFYLSSNSTLMVGDTGVYFMVASHFNNVSGKFCTDTNSIRVYKDSLVPFIKYQNLPKYCEGDIIDLTLSVPTDTTQFGGNFSFHSKFPCNAGNQINQSTIALKDTSFIICYKAGNCESNITLPAFVNPKPWASIVNFDTICNSSANGNTTFYNFDNAVKQGDKNGIWNAISVNPSAGTFPVLDFNGVVPGNYLFSYKTQSAMTPCSEVMYELELNVKECSCPNVDIDSTVKLCNSGLSFELNDLLSNLENGTFSIVSVPFGSNPAIIQNSSIVFNKKDPGVYGILFKLDSVLSGCPNSFPGTIEIVQDNDAALVSQISVCGDTIKGINDSQIIKNTLFISGDQSGIWSSFNLTGVNLNNLVWDFNGIFPGTYQLDYNLTASFPCADKVYSLFVTVKNCSCLELELVPKLEICHNVMNYDLNQLIVAAAPGSWKVISNPAGNGQGTVLGDKFICNGCLEGKYILSYKLNTSSQNCPDSMLVELIVRKENNAGIATGDLYFCENTDTLINLFGQLHNEDGGGEWFLKSSLVQPFWISSDSAISLKKFKPGIYSFLYKVTNNHICEPDSAIFSLNIQQKPILQLLKDTFISCLNPVINIVPVVNSNQPVTYEWTQNGMFYNSDSVIKVNFGGFIECKITSGICSAKKFMNINNFNKPFKLGGLKVFNPDCLKKKGKFKLLNLVGGTPPINFSLNNQNQTFKDSLELDEGQYLIKFSDNYGCSWDTVAVIKKEVEPSLILPNDVTIETGDHYTIEYETVPVKVQAENLRWNENGHKFDCLDCETITVAPLYTSHYELIIKTLSGCLIKDDINIFVATNRRVYIPNGFSPNGDNVNDLFAIFGGKNTVKVDVFEIFDRWGDKVHSANDFIPDGVQGSWDGRIDGKPGSVSVYVYYAIVEFADGKKELFKGDINLIR